jgi:hypothetical protein
MSTIDIGPTSEFSRAHYEDGYDHQTEEALLAGLGGCAATPLTRVVKRDYTFEEATQILTGPDLARVVIGPHIRGGVVSMYMAEVRNPTE